MSAAPKADSAEAATAEAVGDAAVALGRALRAQGFGSSIDEELALIRAFDEIDARDRSQVYWACRATLTRGPDEMEVFDAIFDRFWEGEALEGGKERMAEHGETDPRLPGPQHGGDSLPQFRLEGRSGHLLDGAANRASQEIPTGGAQEPGGGERKGVLAAYSPEEAATDATSLEYARDELAAVKRLGDDLRRAHPERISRRQRRSSGRGRLDLRDTVRASLRTDGEALRPAWTTRSRRPRRVVMICDVSGSMERYSRILLASLQAAVCAGIKAEAFVFATGLTRLTATLRDRDVGRALEQARAAVGDWSGGTRIGGALEEFNRVFARLGLARGGIVIVVSDGWDRGDPELLAEQVRRLQLQSRRLIWVNPRAGDLDLQPLAIGMRAALPHVDHYLPGHDAGAVASLLPLIDGLGVGRPPRRQRPVSSTRSMAPTRTA